METDELLTNANDDLLFVTKRPDIVMASGQGMYITDTMGKEYLDFIGGWAVNCLGHSPKVIHEVLNEQSTTLVNGSPQFYNQPMIEFARLLSQNSCMDRSFFCSTGSEANESAIKLARKYGLKEKKGAYEIITTLNSFHGRTLTTMSATGKKAWGPLFEPKSKGFLHVPFNDLDAVKDVLTEKTAAVMIEPIQAEGGVNEADLEYFKGLRELCDETGTLLIFDEVQTGIGRTGKLFAYEHYGIEPDIMTLGKGLGGGFPIAAMLCKESLNIFEPGEQGGTYTGQPLGMAIGKAVVETVIEKKLSGNADEMGAYLKERLETELSDSGVSRIRGKGLLIAFDLDSKKAPELVTTCLDMGLIVNAPNEKSIRLIPPLIIRKEDCDNAVAILKKALGG